MDFKLHNKVAVVTAATANIGRAVALALAAEGVVLIAVGRDQAAGEKLVQSALQLGATAVEFVATDLTQPTAAAAILMTASQYGPIEVLVNGVGGNAEQGFFVESSPEKWADDIDLNFGTVLRLCHAVLPQMIAQRSGSIINIGSTAGLTGDYMLAVYSAMKGAVHSFTKVLAKEVGQHDVRVNAIAPYATIGKTADDFSLGSRFHPDNAFFTQHAKKLTDYDKAMRQKRPALPKPFAEPTEISALAVYLASCQASFVTGQVWSVDGGALL